MNIIVSYQHFTHNLSVKSNILLHLFNRLDKMEKLVYDQSQKAFLIKTFQAQIDDVKKQLKDLYGFLAQLDASLVDPEYQPNGGAIETITRVSKASAKETKSESQEREPGRDYFTKAKEIIATVGNPLTSREILKYLYDFYPDEFNKDDDRKHIATLSSILNEKVGEGRLAKHKPEGKHATFDLVITKTLAEAEFEFENENAENVRSILEKTA